MKPNAKVTFKYLATTLIFALTSSIIFLAPGADAAQPDSSKSIADRVVVAINNIPYSQNQIESYIDVKESLRDDASKSQTVNSSNWTEALDVFVTDTSIHQ